MEAELPTLHLLLLAGGRGSRAEAAELPPKQFRETGRGPLLTVSLTSFLSGPAAPASVTVTTPPALRDLAAAALAPVLDGSGVPWLLADAGANRTASALSAAEALAAADHAPAPDDLVAIHDAARPFASGDLLAAVAAAAARHGAALPGVPVADTVVRHDPDTEEPVIYLERSRLHAVQTPQVFRWAPLLAAHRWAAGAGRAYTDDGSLLAERGTPPVVVPGEASNWKVTDDADWHRAAALLAD